MEPNPKLSPHYSPDREDRVAAALRENLRKRKQQQAQKSKTETQATKDQNQCP